MKLSDVLNFDIARDQRVTCFAKTMKDTQCANPVARKDSNKAHDILQHVMTFQDWEHDLIENYIQELSDLLIHGEMKHANSEFQKQGRRTEWLRMWHTQLDENQQLREEIQENTPNDLDSLGNGLHEAAFVPPITQHAGIPPEPSPLAIQARTEPAQFQFTSILETVEDSSHALGTTPPAPSHHIQEDIQIVPDQPQLFSESLVPSAFMTANQRVMIETVIKCILQFCLAFQIQLGPSIEFKLLTGMRIPLSSFPSSPYLIFPIIYLCGQVMNILFGPISGLFLVLLVTLGAWCSVRPKKTTTTRTLM
ncbi:uncharacterized protein N7483_002230 [Penicillium malachiteum]|uniref:uncharacterized protein n=1 Tax=Penicillium malachiteum TaxID=1324776 RepID=UPI0025482864|nr:uncharacterized protein N7483_002230 [Penicillium malachiteum]KAJ5737105.1 hypothetical protein N7483_002230 [Penicillium malachiteum]